MTNIIANAVDACDRKGRVELSFGISRHFSDMMRLERRSGPIVHGHSEKEEEFLRITIHDNGPGIPAEVRDKLFVPFFTTKKTGTGLGLAICRRIVELMGGRVWADASPDLEGARFTIELPAA